ncbi:MAG: hypothetical protein NTX50_22350 [Candidatus Sumerlaeota bacterium]|nr:hypothetical protein [Candidatus Sumerlaeota bacterium]
MKHLHSMFAAGICLAAILIVGRPAPVAAQAAAPAAVPAAPGAANDRLLESYVTDEYELTIRLNTRRILDSPELESIRSRVLGPQVTQMVDGVQQLTGINLLKDIDTVMLAGYFAPDKRDDGLVFLRGRWDENALILLFQMSPQYERIPAGKVTIHGFWREKEKDMRYVAFLDMGVAVIGKKEGVESLCKSLEDKSKLLTNAPGYAARLKEVPANALVGLVAVKPHQLPQDKPGRILMKNIRAASGYIDVNNGVQISLSLEMNDVQSMLQMKDIAQGILAVGQMIDDMPKIGDLAKKVQLGTKETCVTASMSMPVDELRETLAMLPPFKMLAGPPQESFRSGANPSSGSATKAKAPAGF